MNDSYYFPHDYHARHDPKVERLRMEIGPVGDGIYWDLVEMLYEQQGYLPLKDIPLFAKSLNTTIELITKIIKTSELFCDDGVLFYSETLLARLRKINAKRRKAKTSANRRWNANALPAHSEGNAIKESKVKESKVKNIKEQQASPALKAAFEKVYEKGNGLNIYALLNKLKKESKVGVQVPEEVLLKVCGSFDKNKVDVNNAWPWFSKALIAEWHSWNAEQQIKQGKEWKESKMPQSISQILGVRKC